MEREDSFFAKNRYLIVVLLGFLSFLGCAFPFVNGKVVGFDTASGEFFKEAGRRTFDIGYIFDFTRNPCWPIITVFGVIVIAIIFACLFKVNKKFMAVSMTLFFVSAVMLLLSNYFFAYTEAASLKAVVKESWGIEQGSFFGVLDYYQDYINIMEPRLQVGAIISIIFTFVAGLAAFSLIFEKDEVSVRDLTEIGMLVAGAVVLDVIFHFIPNIAGQAGSISIALLPLLIISLRHGPIKGFMASSFVFGLITCLTDGYGLYLYPLDYFVAFSGVAIIGIFRNQILGENQTTYNLKGELLILLSVLLMGVVRFIGSGLSSIINYGYSFKAAFIANIIYIGVSTLLCAVILMAAYGPLINLNNHFPTKRENNN